GGGGGFMTARGSANLLTRTTAILATLFFLTAIGLTVLSEFDRGSSSILQGATTGGEEGAAPTSVLDALNALQGDSDLPVPAADGTVTPPADAAAPAATTPAPATTTPAPAVTPAPASDLPVPVTPTPEPATPAPAAAPEPTPAAPATN
ncbi:MAG: secG, partial [Devosia sp.]|nr:secG [Devosia sp.]